MRGDFGSVTPLFRGWDGFLDLGDEVGRKLRETLVCELDGFALV